MQHACCTEEGRAPLTVTPIRSTRAVQKRGAHPSLWHQCTARVLYRRGACIPHCGANAQHACCTEEGRAPLTVVLIHSTCAVLKGAHTPHCGSNAQHACCTEGGAHLSLWCQCAARVLYRRGVYTPHCGTNTLYACCTEEGHAPLTVAPIDTCAVEKGARTPSCGINAQHPSCTEEEHAPLHVAPMHSMRVVQKRGAHPSLWFQYAARMLY